MHILGIATAPDPGEPRGRSRVTEVARAFAEKADTITELVVPGQTDPPSVARLVTAVEEIRPDLVIFMADVQGAALAPMLAARLGWSVLPDLIRMERDGTAVLGTRTVNRGSHEVTLKSQTTHTVVTIKASALRAEPAPRSAAQARTQAQTLTPEPASPVAPAWSAVAPDDGARLPITEADIVVGIGRGVVSDEQLVSVERLAGILGASVGASRQAIENGRAAASVKVGDTGLKLGAAMYVAVGISGANQHMSGIASCLSLVVVNKDPRAAILGAASAGVIGDMSVLLPQLCDALEARLT